MHNDEGGCGTAADYLRRRSRAARACHQLRAVRTVVIACGCRTTTGVVTSLLRVLFGYASQLELKAVGTLGQALDAMLAVHPDLFVLGATDSVGPASPGVLAIIRRFGYRGPVIALADPTGDARAHLLAAGAADVIGRDELEAARLAEALAACWPSLAPAAE
jgi:hypothetical protein